MKKIKIAIISYYFYPFNAVGVVRPANWALWLSEAGYEVYVISGVNSRSLNSEDVRNLGFNSLWTKGIFHNIMLDGPFLSMLRRLISLRQRLVTSRAQQSERAQSTLMAKIVKNFLPSSLRSVFSRSGIFTYRLPSLHDLSILPTLRELFTIKPDIIISTHSPYSNLVSGLLYSLIYPSTKYVIDFRDMWTLSHVTTGFPIFKSIESTLEYLSVKRANAISVISKGQSNLLSSKYKESSPHIVYNSSLDNQYYFDQSNASDCLPMRRKFTIAYTGTLYPQYQDPSPLFLKIQQLRDDGHINVDNFCIALASRNNHVFINKAKSYGVDQFIDNLGYLSKSQVLNLQNQADCLLLIENHEHQSKGILPLKGFEYLLTGKPILLLGVSSESELSSYISSHGILLSLYGLSDLIISSFNQQPIFTKTYDQRNESKYAVYKLVKSIIA